MQGIEEAVKMQTIVDLGCGSDVEDPMRLLVASIRSADEIATLAAKGCNTFTIAPVRGQAGRARRGLDVGYGGLGLDANLDIQG